VGKKNLVDKGENPQKGGGGGEQQPHQIIK